VVIHVCRDIIVIIIIATGAVAGIPKCISLFRWAGSKILAHHFSQAQFMEPF
jgi:hypothetical protein